MDVTIRFSHETVKELMARLRLAIRQLNRPLIQQLGALLLLHDGLETWSIAGRVGVSTTTIYSLARWLFGQSLGQSDPWQLLRTTAQAHAEPIGAAQGVGQWRTLRELKYD